MANMSYCRFENTYHDLYDCFENLENNLSDGLSDGLSDSEERYREKLIELCRDIAEAGEEIVNTEPPYSAE